MCCRWFAAVCSIEKNYFKQLILKNLRYNKKIKIIAKLKDLR